MIIFTFPCSCTQTEADKHKCCREMWMKAEGMRVEETRKESEGQSECQKEGRGGGGWMQQHREARKERRE